MGISLSKIANNAAPVSLQVAGETVNVVYLPNKITDALLAQMQSGTLDANQVMVSLIKSWDIYQDDEMTVMLPLDEAGLSQLGAPIKIDIVKAIVDNMRPNSSTTQTPIQS